MSLIKIADRVQQAYEIISSKNPDGGVTPYSLVKYARPKGSPLHEQFDWDDKKAAERFRLWQARELLSSVSIEVGPKQRGRNFQSIKINPDDGQERKYYSIDTIMSSPSLKKRAIAQMVSEVKWMITKYQTYKEIYRLINEPEVKLLEAEMKKSLK